MITSPAQCARSPPRAKIRSYVNTVPGDVGFGAVTTCAKPIRRIPDTFGSVIEHRSARGRRWCINNKRRSSIGRCGWLSESPWVC